MHSQDSVGLDQHTIIIAVLLPITIAPDPAIPAVSVASPRPVRLGALNILLEGLQRNISGFEQIRQSMALPGV